MLSRSVAAVRSSPAIPAATSASRWCSIRCITFALLERKPGALDQAAPLADWEMPESCKPCAACWKRGRPGQGRREYVQVLRLWRASIDASSVAAVQRGAAKAGDSLRCDQASGVVSGGKRPARLDLSLYPYLPRAAVHDHDGLKLHGAAVGGRIMNEMPRTFAGCITSRSSSCPRCCASTRSRPDNVRAENKGHVPYPEPPDRAGTDRPGTAHGGTPDQGGKVPAPKAWIASTSRRSPALNKMQVLELARCDWIERRENVIALGPVRHRQDPLSPSALGWPPAREGFQSLHHSRSTGPRVDGSARRETPPALAEADARHKAADHRRAWASCP